MNCCSQLDAVDSYVMTGRDYIYSESRGASDVCFVCVDVLRLRLLNASVEVRG